ncbi:MAG: succinyl-diaminopimelate desuccinylase [Gammaproteobacteria bacterium]|nr:succinyl-diaminopimelate desuccinylase [Gammaproteobacteria bacterium]
MSSTLELTKDLIARQSVTPEDAGCQQLMAERLKKIGFEITHLKSNGVTNLWARLGTEAPLFAFAGHTDVVPTGPAEKWTFPPFEPTEHQGHLYGRGTADMKGSLAAMITASETFIARYGQPKGSIAFLITSDEEGPATDGTVRVLEHIASSGEKIDWCLVGEPSSTSKLGDVVKNGRRGSLSATLTIMGKQGHVAYPHLAQNPVHIAMPVLDELTNTEWDKGNSSFPATTFQISNLHSGTGATNVIPGEIEVLFNFRFSTELNEESIKQRVTSILDRHKINYEIEWNLSGNPFLTDQGQLVEATKTAIKSVTGYDTELSTAGGTSDGRFIAPTGAQVIELGPLNKSIHQIDENVSIADLEQLSVIYAEILKNLLT